MKNLRKDSGFFRPGLSNFSSIQTLFGDFINDRTSPSLLKNYHDEKAKILTEKKWDNGAPYERVIETNEDLKEIIQNPNIIKNSICIIEPADHVGKNLIGEDVRASSNIASLCQFISDCDSILIPLWKTGKLDNKLLIDLLQNSLAVFVEGGHPTVKDSNSFKDLNISLDELQELTEEIILSRNLNDKKITLDLIGKKLNISKERVRQIESAALKKLKKNIKDEKVKNDDYGMMKEVLFRRFSKAIKEKSGSLSLPDLIMIDGGKGQYSVSREVLNELGLHDLPILAVAKGKKRNAGEEKIYHRGKETILDKNNPLLFFIQRLRDEAHRFAISTHRAKRKKNLSKSLLDQIHGIGKQRKRALLNHFGSARAVESASFDDLKSVDGIEDNIAKKIYDYFHE